MGSIVSIVKHKERAKKQQPMKEGAVQRRAAAKQKSGTYAEMPNQLCHYAILFEEGGSLWVNQHFDNEGETIMFLKSQNLVEQKRRYTRTLALTGTEEGRASDVTVYKINNAAGYTIAKDFHFEIDLLNSAKRHFDKKPQSPKSSSRFTNKSSMHLCPFRECLLAFYDLTDLKKHINQRHIQDINLLTFQCDRCKAVMKKNSVKSHDKWCNNNDFNNQFVQCDVCMGDFMHRKNINIHRNSKKHQRNVEKKRSEDDDAAESMVSFSVAQTWNNQEEEEKHHSTPNVPPLCET